MDAGEQTMAIEREDIVRDLAVLLQSISQVNMEPNGLSFVGPPLKYLRMSDPANTPLNSATRSAK